MQRVKSREDGASSKGECALKDPLYAIETYSEAHRNGHPDPQTPKPQTLERWLVLEGTFMLKASASSRSFW